MNRLFTPRISIFLGMILCLGVGAFAQNPRAEEIREGNRIAPGQAAPEGRPNLLQELGLTAEQIQAVRRINQDRKPLEQAARQRFQSAQRALNGAIYADTVNETDVQAKLAEFQAAQSELARIKFTNELAVRKVLTPDQLIKFRELRRRFAEARDERQEGRPTRRQMRRLRRGNFPPG